MSHITHTMKAHKCPLARSVQRVCRHFLLLPLCFQFLRASLFAFFIRWRVLSAFLFLCFCLVGARKLPKNWWSHIDASLSRQPLVKGERLVRYEVNAVMLRTVVDWGLRLLLSSKHDCCASCVIDGIILDAGAMCPFCWAEARLKIARMTLTIKLDGNWSSFQLANSAPPLSVTDSALAPSARIASLTKFDALSLQKIWAGTACNPFIVAPHPKNCWQDCHEICITARRSHPTFGQGKSLRVIIDVGLQTS